MSKSTDRRLAVQRGAERWTVDAQLVLHITDTTPWGEVDVVLAEDYDTLLTHARELWDVLDELNWPPDERSSEADVDVLLARTAYLEDA